MPNVLSTGGVSRADRGCGAIPPSASRFPASAKGMKRVAASL